MKHPITLVLLGDIAAGKGTQAKILARQFRLAYIGTGEFTRKVWHRKGLEAVKHGSLMPADLIKNFLRREIAKAKPGQSLIIDGGKMPSEAQLIYRMLTAQKRKILVIYLTIPQRESFKRLQGRLQAAGRYDDRPEAVRNRINYYQKIYSKTVKFWQSKGLLRKVKGNEGIAQVTREIAKVIKRYYGPH